MEWIAATALPALVTAMAIVALMRSGIRQRLIDRPNERSLHAEPTPRLGGLGLMAGALPVAAVLGGPSLGVALACALALSALSAVDDWRSLPVALRLGAHAAAAVAVVYSLDAGPWSVPLFLAIVWMTNLYNFMDGADALAGLMAAFGFGALAVAAAWAGAMPLALACAAIASAAAGFLAFNFPPARVFMGDAGSVPLGFLAAALGAQGAQQGAWPAWFPVLVFSPFIVDATVTIARRLFRGERVWIAHREHAYQRLVLSGWTPRRLALAMALLMFAAAASALAAVAGGQMLQRGIIVGSVVLYGLLVPVLELKYPRQEKNGSGARRSNPTPGEQE